MSKLKTFLDMVETLPAETLSYLDDELANQFIAPLEVYNLNASKELLSHFTTKEAFSDTNSMGKYGDVVNVYHFDGKPFVLLHQTGKWLRDHTPFVLDPVVFGQVQIAILEEYRKNIPPAVVIGDDFFESDVKWINYLTDPEKFPYKYADPY